MEAFRNLSGRALGSAGLDAGGLDAVLLVGGSSRIPLIAQLVSAELGRPVAVDADPKTTTATGAALAITPLDAPAVAAVPAPDHLAAGMAPVPDRPVKDFGEPDIPIPRRRRSGGGGGAPCCWLQR